MRVIHCRCCILISYCLKILVYLSVLLSIIIISVVSNYFFAILNGAAKDIFIYVSRHIHARILGRSYLGVQFLNCKMFKYSTLQNKAKLRFKVVTQFLF